MSTLTIEDLLKAKELLEQHSYEPKVYVAPDWIYNNEEYLKEFTSICMGLHPGEIVEVVRVKKIK